MNSYTSGSHCPRPFGQDIRSIILYLLALLFGTIDVAALLWLSIGFI
jgi:hypothetical protein